ncbi:MAG TPA: hypothetical protein VJ723_06715, partial [Candidatus Angelobacter sp.]|nr:hypothetical protein [Candidatus Angelobacter sp.]
MLETTESKQVIRELVSAYTEEMPPNTSIVFGMIGGSRLELSGDFVSDPQKLHVQLDQLVEKTQTGAQRAHMDAYGALLAALSFIEYPVVPSHPRPGGHPALRQRPPNLPRNGARPGDAIIFVVNPLAVGKIWPPAADELVARFANDGVRLFTVFVDANPNRDPNNESGLDYFSAFSHRTGGDAHILYPFDKRPDTVWQSERYLWLNSYGW